MAKRLIILSIFSCALCLFANAQTSCSGAAKPDQDQKALMSMVGKIANMKGIACDDLNPIIPIDCSLRLLIKKEIESLFSMEPKLFGGDARTYERAFSSWDQRLSICQKILPNIVDIIEAMKPTRYLQCIVLDYGYGKIAIIRQSDHFLVAMTNDSQVFPSKQDEEIQLKCGTKSAFIEQDKPKIYNGVIPGKSYVATSQALLEHVQLVLVWAEINLTIDGINIWTCSLRKTELEFDTNTKRFVASGRFLPSNVIRIDERDIQELKKGIQTKRFTGEGN
jgi:hypothetical protein